MFSQIEYYPLEINQYPFIDYKNNIFTFPSDSSSYERLFAKFDSLIIPGKGKLNVVHIGGSHIQADVYTHQMRKRMQQYYPGLNGGRGFIFPNRIAHTNTPSNFRLAYTGNWDYCRNVQNGHTCRLGLSGITITTSDSLASISFNVNNDSSITYDFNRIKLFYETSAENYHVEIETPVNISDSQRFELQGYTIYQLDGYTDTLTIRIRKADTLPGKFTFYGISLENDNSGVCYNAIGVNGAKLPSYLKCELLSEHLQALNPDWVIISIGTNDAYTRRFNSEEYKLNYMALIEKIRSAVPDAAILLTVPNDSYLYRRYINRNTAKVRSVIINLAGRYNCGVWDFYGIMGGLNSAAVWRQNGLMQYDKIHFNKKGYILKGNLLFNAFLKSYENHVIATDRYRELSKTDKKSNIR